MKKNLQLIAFNLLNLLSWMLCGAASWATIFYLSLCIIRPYPFPTDIPAVFAGMIVGLTVYLLIIFGNNALEDNGITDRIIKFSGFCGCIIGYIYGVGNQHTVLSGMQFTDNPDFFEAISNMGVSGLIGVFAAILIVFIFRHFEERPFLLIAVSLLMYITTIILCLLASLLVTESLFVIRTHSLSSSIIILITFAWFNLSRSVRRKLELFISMTIPFLIIGFSPVFFLFLLIWYGTNPPVLLCTSPEPSLLEFVLFPPLCKLKLNDKQTNMVHSVPIFRIDTPPQKEYLIDRSVISAACPRFNRDWIDSSFFRRGDEEEAIELLKERAIFYGGQALINVSCEGGSYACCGCGGATICQGKVIKWK